MKISFKKPFTIQDIVIISVVLSIYLIFKLIQILTPSFIYGIRIQIIDVVLIISSLIIGSIRTIIVVFVYTTIIVWMNPLFIDGVWYVGNVLGTDKMIIEYFLDYLIPNLILAIIPGLFRLFKYSVLNVVLFVSVAVFVAYISHAVAGYLLFSSFANQEQIWPWLNPLIYSFALNAIWSSITWLISVIIIIFITKIFILDYPARFKNESY